MPWSRRDLFPITPRKSAATERNEGTVGTAHIGLGGAESPRQTDDTKGSGSSVSYLLMMSHHCFI